MNTSVLAFDIGASSGRGMLVTYNGSSFELEEVHRFKNPIIEENNSYYWNIPYLINELEKGIKLACQNGSDFTTIGIDTWGCDYGWLDNNGNLIGNPRCYRSKLDDSVIDEVHNKIPLGELYSINGNAFFPFNTIYQVYNDVKKEGIIDKGGKQILFTPNLLSYLLTGERVWEYTISSTSGLMDVRSRGWSDEIFSRLDLPRDIVGNIFHPTETNLSLKTSIKERLDLDRDIKVVNIASHDSASAVIGAGVEDDSAYIINGTWSLIGVERSEPILKKDGVQLGIVNEGSINKRIRFLNLTLGTWLFQSLKEQWNNTGSDYSFSDFSIMSVNSKEERYIDITDEFISPKNMEQLISNKFYKKYNHRLSERKDILRVVYNTLANHYENSIDLIEKYSNSKIEKVILVGGGIQDKMLVDSVKTHLNKEVVLGPIEASAMGNAICQFINLGVFKDINEYKSKVGGG